MVSADHGNDSTANTNDRYYAFDAIGNRDYVRHGVYQDSSGDQRQYTADFANEYDDVDTNGTSVTQGYDANGNMTSGQVPADQGSASALTWDAENRLIKAVVGGVTTIYEYDHMGRRIRKEVQDTTTVTTRYIYNGWNLCAEYDGTTGVEKVYTWGMDLSGSMQGAGGVGGLLMVTEDPGGTPSEYYPTYDGNGNVSEYLDGAGTVVAHYEYASFGDLISSSGTKAASFAHRFSTKYLDDETGLYYYGFRYYDPVTGRWPSRDPIGERGGINLYGMVGNDAVNQWDLLGLKFGQMEINIHEKTEVEITETYVLFDWEPKPVCECVYLVYSSVTVVETHRTYYLHWATSPAKDGAVAAVMQVVGEVPGLGALIGTGGIILDSAAESSNPPPEDAWVYDISKSLLPNEKRWFVRTDVMPWHKRIPAPSLEECPELEPKTARRPMPKNSKGEDAFLPNRNKK